MTLAEKILRALFAFCVGLACALPICGFFPLLALTSDYLQFVKTHTLWATLPHLVSFGVGVMWSPRALQPSVPKFTGAGLVFATGSFLFGVVHLVLSMFLSSAFKMMYFPMFVFSLYVGGMWMADFCYRIAPALVRRVLPKQ